MMLKDLRTMEDIISYVYAIFKAGSSITHKCSNYSLCMEYSVEQIVNCNSQRSKLDAKVSRAYRTQFVWATS
jgi:hypothetical protein